MEEPAIDGKAERSRATEQLLVEAVEHRCTVVLRDCEGQGIRSAKRALCVPDEQPREIEIRPIGQQNLERSRCHGFERRAQFRRLLCRDGAATNVPGQYRSELDANPMTDRSVALRKIGEERDNRGTGRFGDQHRDDERRIEIPQMTFFGSKPFVPHLTDELDARLAERRHARAKSGQLFQR